MDNHNEEYDSYQYIDDIDENAVVYQCQLVSANSAIVKNVGYFKECNNILINKFKIMDDAIECSIISCIMDQTAFDDISLSNKFPLIKLSIKLADKPNVVCCNLYFVFSIDKNKNDLVVGQIVNGGYSIILTKGDYMANICDIDDCGSKDEMLECLIDILFLDSIKSMLEDFVRNC